MRVLFILFVFLNLIPRLNSAQDKTRDSLLTVLNSAKEDTSKVLILMDLSNLSMNNKDVKAYASLALTLAEKLQFKRGMADALNNIGYVYDLTGEGGKALEFYNKSLVIRETLSDTLEIANTIGNIGGVHENLGDISKALQCYLKSLKLCEIKKDEQGVAVIINNMGSLYYNHNNFEKALECFQKSLNIKKKLGQKEGVATSLNNVAGVYHALGDWKKAFEYYEQSLDLYKEIGFKEGIGFTLNNLGYVYEMQHEFEKAFDHYIESLKVREGNNDKRGSAITLNNIGGLKLKQKKYAEAENYCLRSLTLAKEIGFPNEISGAAQTLYYIYRSEKKGMEALAMHELFITMRDSVINNKNQKLALQKQMQYEFDKKESIAKAEQEKKDGVYKAELERQTLQRNAFIVGFILMLALAALIYHNYRNKRKAHGIIEKQKLEVEEKNKSILDSINYAKRIQQSLMPNEKFIAKTMNKLKTDKK